MQRLGDFFARLTWRLLPDPMVIACALTILTFGFALLWPKSDALESVGAASRALRICRLWFDGVWDPGFMVFALQMCLVLLTGFGLAKAPPAERFLRSLARGAGSERSAVVLVAAVSCVGCWINWGFGLIAGGLLASRVRSEMIARGRACRYALVVAAAYAGMMIWHGGLSGSAPLRVAKEGVRIATGAQGHSEGLTLPSISVGDTILSPVNLALTIALFFGVPAVLAAMAGGVDGSQSEVHERSQGESQPSVSDEPSNGSNAARGNGATLAFRINRSRTLPLLIALGFAVVVIDQLRESGSAAVGLNLVNAVFLSLGLILHRDLPAYVEAVAEGGRAVTGIILQFPLYSGIQGIMFGAGLAAAMSNWFVDLAISSAAWLNVSPSHTFPLATLASAGIVNFFIPSGGGQWIVQGPIMCGAAQSLGLPIAQTVLAVSYGDQLTNMVQPFWALPLMGITGVSVRRFIGYCVLLMILAGPAFAVALLFM